MVYTISKWTTEYTPYVDGTIFALIALLIVGYFGNWIEHCNCKQMLSLCCECIRYKQNQIVLFIALIIWILLVIIYILNSTAHIDHKLWDIGHYMYSTIYPLFALYNLYHLYEIHKKYGSILLFIQLQPNAFVMLIGILLIIICVSILEWVTLIDGVDWQTSDEAVQIALALFGLDATAIMLVFKMKEIESIAWAFTSMNQSGFEALEQFLRRNNNIFRCSCNMFLFIYFGFGIFFQFIIISLVLYTTIQSRLTNAETWIFYISLPFVFAPLFILTYFIHQHHKFIMEVEYNKHKICAINDGSVDIQKLEIRQRKLNKYKCMDRIYQLLIVLIFICAMYLTLIAAVSPSVSSIDFDLYFFGQFNNLYFLFIFLLLLFMGNKQILSETWKCNQCLFNNDTNQNNVYCQLCGAEITDIDWTTDENQPLLPAFISKHMSSVLTKEKKPVLLMVKDGTNNNRINKEFADLNLEIKIFGKDYINQIQCSSSIDALKKCECVERIIDVCILYRHHRTDLDEYFDLLTAEKEYEISDLLNDFAHLLKYHSFGLNNQNAFGYVEQLVGICDETCEFAERHFGDIMLLSQEVGLEKQLLFRTMDRIHCFLFHNFQRDRNNIVIDDEIFDVSILKRRDIDPARSRYEMKHVENEEEKNFSEFGFGSFIYYELLTPKYKSLKDELSCNEMCKIKRHIWDLMLAKATKLSKCNIAKQMKNINNSLQCISIAHILSIVIYTDCSNLQYNFRLSFRKNKPMDDNKTIIEKHCNNYYHWGRWLNDAIYTFGNTMKSNERLYHGMNIQLLFKSFSTDFNTPTSTTPSFAKAQSFAGDHGIVLLLKPKWKDSSQWNRTKKMEVSWISDYCDELEHLYYGNFNQLLIDEIWDMNMCQPCHEYIKSMQLLQMICDGNIGNNEYNMNIIQVNKGKYKHIYDKILMKLIYNELKIKNDKLNENLNDIYKEAQSKKNLRKIKKRKFVAIRYFNGDIPEYVQHMMHHFVVNRKKIAILNGIEYLKTLIGNTYQSNNNICVYCPYCDELTDNNNIYKEIMEKTKVKEKLLKKINCSYCFQKIIGEIIKTKKMKHMDDEVMENIFYVCCNKKCEYYLKYLLCESCLITIPSEFLKSLFPKGKFYYVLPILNKNKQNALKVELLRSIQFL